MFYNDGSSLSLGAAKWFVGKRYNLSNMSIVLLMVSTQNREEMLADTMAGKQQREKEQVLEQSFIDIREVLLEGGMEEKDIERVLMTVTEKIPQYRFCERRLSRF